MATAGAQIVALPLLLARFHAVSWIAPLANLVAVPISGLLLTAAWLGIAIDLAAPGLGAPWLHACEALSLALRIVTERAARAPHALVATGHHPLPVALAALGALLAVAAGALPRDLESRNRPVTKARGSRFDGVRGDRSGAGRGWATPAPIRARTRGRGARRGAGTRRAGSRTVARGHRSAAAPRCRTERCRSVSRWPGVRSLEALAFTHDDGTIGADPR
jgi:hypothetical protein